jgi:hypothetical protein
MEGQDRGRLGPHDRGGAHARLEEERHNHQGDEDFDLAAAPVQRQGTERRGDDQNPFDAGHGPVTELDRGLDGVLRDELAVAQRPGAATALARPRVRDRRSHDQDQEHPDRGHYSDPLDGGFHSTRCSSSPHPGAYNAGWPCNLL